MKKRRTAFDKLNTLFFGKDLRITTGEPYTEIREFDYSSYYPEDKYIFFQELPVGNVYDICDYGASVNNEDNAQFINEAIAKASETGGTVLVQGGEFISTTVELKSNVTLFIAKGSAICANKTGEGYRGALLVADNAENITLTGGGKLKGNGHLFGRKPQADKNNTSPEEYIDVIEMRRNYRAQLRFAHPSKYGGVIAFTDCSNIIADNFIIENSAHWTFKLSNCSNVSIKNFVINNNRNVANADGIDIAGSSHIKINHCYISTADDGIVIKNANWLGNREPMKDLDISDCEIISRTNAIKVGTETTYDISNIKISRCRLFMTDLFPGTVSGISLEACDGTRLENVYISDIEMDRCTCPLFLRLGNRNRASIVNSQSSNAIEFGKKVKFIPTSPKDEFNHKSELKNITVRNVVAKGVQIPVIISGYKQNGTTKNIENVTLENIDLTYSDIPETVDRRLFIPEYAKEYPESWRFRNLPSYALWVRHAENVCIKNFVCSHPQKTWKKEINDLSAVIML